MTDKNQNLAIRIAAHPFTAAMSAPHLNVLAECAMVTQFDAGQVIFKAGEMANRFYLIESGNVVLEHAISGEERVIIDSISNGGLLGWGWLFPPHVWQFDARATEPTSAIFFYGTILREQCEGNPALGYDLFKRMSEVMISRLQAARRQLIDARRKPRGHELERTDMPADTTIELKEPENLVVIRYRGRIGLREAAAYVDETREALSRIRTGFRLLTDLTQLESMDVACAPHIRTIMDLLNEKGVATVVRVIPDPGRDIGLQIMSSFHYAPAVRIITCATLEEAAEILASA